ncbi:MAG: type II toxin-antitoxin system Phd/YefM family antitoxin [Candidatus Dormibacteraceae bacterium]
MVEVVVGVHEAKTHLSRLLERVEAGEEIVITRRGVEVARLIAASSPGRRQFGQFAGQFTVPEDFDEPLPGDLVDLFER